ncbi:uncharacterized protein [Apostichopus japonicus]|uniref:uncharacterized protein isoform X3 n=1 Tax=Stichopus japonicus TaxID=307972 RepID=UPI003AB1D8BD
MWRILNHRSFLFDSDVAEPISTHCCVQLTAVHTLRLYVSCWRMDVVLRFHLVLFVCSGFHGHGFSDINISANKHDNVTLNCSLGIDVTPSEQKWNYNGQTIYSGYQVLWSRKSAVIQPPHYALVMNNVSISEEGTYQCCIGTTRCVQYQLSVNVPPRSFYILSGEFDLTDGDYLPIKMNQTANVSCYVIGVRPKNKLKWNVNNIGNITDINYSVEDSVDQGTFNIHSSFQFQPPTVSGTLTCARTTTDSALQESIKVRFSAYVAPKLFYMMVDGINVTNGEQQLLEADQPIKVFCQVLETHPENSISWWVDGILQESSVTPYYSGYNLEGQRLHSTNSTLNVYPRAVNGSVECLRSTLGGAIRDRIVLYYSTFVLVKLSLLVDGIGGLKDSYIEGDVIRIICKAFGSRTKIELAITVNNATLSPAWKKMTSFDEEKQTYNVTMEVRFYTIEMFGTIGCSCKANGCHGNPRLERTFYMLDKDQTSKIDSSNDLLLILGCFLGSFSVAICIIFACFKAIMKRQTYLLSLLREHDVPGETDVQIHTLSRSMPHENRASVKSNIGCYTTRIISDEDEGEEISSQDRTSRCRRLPEIPNDEEESGEYAYYSDSKEIDSKTQMFKLQDVCVLAKLNFGTLYKRWTGTITHKDNLNKCVVITTESGKNETNKRLHWNAFVRRLLELPANSKNLVGTEGIYIDGDQIYLLQEHLVSQTLQTLMADGCFETNWSSSMARNFILDVLGGITLLQSYGLLHPGLSRSKILVTSSRNCKLYDFCLPDDASLIVRSIKSKVKCTQNQLPLESWQRNEYTKESDIWSAAVVIWEIMSNGTSFPGRDEAISDWSYRANLSDCSTTNCELRDELLLRCWQTDVSKRPSILELRKSYEQISSQSDLQSSYMTMS